MTAPWVPASLGAREGGGCDDAWSEPSASGVCDGFDAAGFVVDAVVEQQLMVRSLIWPEPVGSHGEVAHSDPLEPQRGVEAVGEGTEGGGVGAWFGSARPGSPRCSSITIRGKRGRPRQRPDVLYADRGYDHNVYRRQVRELGIRPLIARRGTEHGSGLGKNRWVVEAAFALLRWFRRLRIRWEIRADIHQAFLTLGCAIICWRRLKKTVLI